MQNSYLSEVAANLRTLASLSNTSNGGETGYWREIALAAEALSATTSTANWGEDGYMLRTAIALEAIAGTSGAEENTGYTGRLKRIVDALEANTGVVNAGSLEHRFYLAGIDAAAGGGVGTALSAPGLTRTSANNVFPVTVDTTLPLEWDLAQGAIIGTMQRTSDPAFLTDIEETSNNLTGLGGPYDWGFSTDVRTLIYARWFAYQGGGRPAVVNYSPIIGSGDTVAPTITSTNSITLSSGVGGTLSLTANELIKSWAITGGANADQFSIAGSTLTYAAQTVGGSYMVQITATDYCDNTTDQTITATLTIKEFSSAATDKHAQIVYTGTPKLTMSGIAAGSQQNARFNADPTPDSVIIEWAPANFTDDIISFGADDASFDNSAYGLRPGLSNSNAFMFVTAAASAGGTWAMDYGSAEPQTGAANDGHVSGDKYHHEYVPSTGTHKIFRIRGGVRTQLGSTVTGLSSSIKRACANTKNGGAVTANIGGSAWAATPTTGFTGYGS